MLLSPILPWRITFFPPSRYHTKLIYVLNTDYATMNGSATVLALTSSLMLKSGCIAIHSGTFCTYNILCTRIIAFMPFSASLVT